jgi:hypothetical protein
VESDQNKHLLLAWVLLAWVLLVCALLVCVPLAIGRFVACGSNFVQAFQLRGQEFAILPTLNISRSSFSTYFSAFPSFQPNWQFRGAHKSLQAIF